MGDIRSINSINKVIRCGFPTQEVIHSQDNSIRELLRAVRDQSDQLNLHRVKIKSLEEKVSESQPKS